MGSCSGVATSRPGVALSLQRTPERSSVREQEVEKSGVAGPFATERAEPESTVLKSFDRRTLHRRRRLRPAAARPSLGGRPCSTPPPSSPRRPSGCAALTGIDGVGRLTWKDAGMVTVDRRRGFLEGVARVCRAVAVVLALLSAGHLIAWANRWYVTEQQARSMWSEGIDFAVWVYERMALVHETLLTAVLLALAAVTVAVLGRRVDPWARRTS
jgi:hypothetical protein